MMVGGVPSHTLVERMRTTTTVPLLTDSLSKTPFFRSNQFFLLVADKIILVLIITVGIGKTG